MAPEQVAKDAGEMVVMAGRLVPTVARISKAMTLPKGGRRSRDSVPGQGGTARCPTGIVRPSAPMPTPMPTTPSPGPAGEVDLLARNGVTATLEGLLATA